MSRYVMVDCVSQFRIRYVIEVPDDANCSSIEYAEDTVTCEKGKEFSQKHLGELIIDSREISLPDAISQFREEESHFADWSDDLIIKNAITEVGYDDTDI